MLFSTWVCMEPRNMILTFLGRYLRWIQLSQKELLLLAFGRMISRVLVLVYIPSNNVIEFLFSPHPCQHFLMIVILCVVLICTSLMARDKIFSCIYWSFVLLLTSVYFSSPFFWLGLLFGGGSKFSEFIIYS